MTSHVGSQSRRASGHFIVWRGYQGRVEAMQPFFGYRVHWMGLRFRHRSLRPLEYIMKGITTLWLLIVYRPSLTWLQLPPTPLLYVTALARRLGLTGSIVADCHPSILSNPWIKSPYLVSILSRSVQIVILHSQGAIEDAVKAGFNEHQCCLLEDRPAPTFQSNATSANDARPQVLFPASFDADEPIAVLLEAARQLPSVRFVLTGDHSRAQGIHDLAALPHNIVLAGWVSIPEYKRLLTASDLIISLTTEEGVQTSVAGEAVGNGKAMVLSDTATLRTLYPKGAVFTRAEAVELGTKIEYALEHKKQLEKESTQLRGEREERWRRQAQCVIDALGNIGGNPLAKSGSEK
jgi:glycosyltransferase involved in cell wall biosynthesis